MKMLIKYWLGSMLILCISAANAQSNSIDYNPCFLKDSVESKLALIRQSPARIFIDSFDCRGNLLDSIAVKYTATKEVKYLIALNAIKTNHYAKTDGLFPHAIQIIAADDFIGFVNQLYSAKGKFLPLQDELVRTMNMVAGGKPLKEKYRGQLSVEILRAKNSADKNLSEYLENLQQKIEGQQYR